MNYAIIMADGVFGFFKRHRRKVVLAAGLAAGGYFLVDFVNNKFFELQDRLATQRTARDK